MISKLIPCPCCGHNDLTLESNDEEKVWKVTCKTCSCTLTSYSEERVKELWNHRVEFGRYIGVIDDEGVKVYCSSCEKYIEYQESYCEHCHTPMLNPDNGSGVISYYIR